MGFAAVHGPMQEAADEAARAVAGQIDPATLQPNFGTEQGAIWVMLGAPP